MNIAITGGIGAGKSTLMAQLQQAYPQARFFSMDAFVDELYTDPLWLDWLEENFQTRERVAISRLAFEDAAVRVALNAQSALKIGVRLGKILADRSALTFVEFPLLFESGLQNEFDHTVLITASTEVRIARVVARGKKTPEQAELADTVIDTTQSDRLAEHTQRLLSTLNTLLSSKETA
jgi:dephospho-CoA kinase